MIYRLFTWLGIILGIITLLCGVTGCKPSDLSSAATYAAADPSLSIQENPLTSPSELSPYIYIISPRPTDIVIGGKIRIYTGVSGFKLVDEMGQPAAAGEGHILYYLDAPLPIPPGQPATISPGSFVETVWTTYEWPDVPEGPHTFSVELVNNDNTPLNPPVTTSLTIQVLAGSDELGGD